MKKQISLIQTLLNAHATLGNIGGKDPYVPIVKQQLMAHIETLRDPTPPPCYGEDDCSTLMLSMCPWRMTCGG
jgi:hypothetical protein